MDRLPAPAPTHPYDLNSYWEALAGFTPAQVTLSLQAAHGGPLLDEADPYWPSEVASRYELDRALGALLLGQTEAKTTYTAAEALNMAHNASDPLAYRRAMLAVLHAHEHADTVSCGLPGPPLTRTPELMEALNFLRLFPTWDRQVARTERELTDREHAAYRADAFTQQAVPLEFPEIGFAYLMPADLPDDRARETHLRLLARFLERPVAGNPAGGWKLLDIEAARRMVTDYHARYHYPTYVVPTYRSFAGGSQENAAWALAVWATLNAGRGGVRIVLMPDPMWTALLEHLMGIRPRPELRPLLTEGERW